MDVYSWPYETFSVGRHIERNSLHMSSAIRPSAGEKDTCNEAFPFQHRRHIKGPPVTVTAAQRRAY